MTKKIGHITNSALNTKKNIDSAELTIQTCDSHPHELSRKEIRKEPHLNKSKYDIDFIINMIKTLIDQIERNKLDRDLAFSLNHSLRRLLSNLQVEKDQGIR